MGFIIHFSDFDAFEGIHEFQQEADAAFKALHLCDNLPIFGIFYPAGQLQSFCHLRQLDAKADLLYTSVEGDMAADKAVFFKIGQSDAIHLMADISISCGF